MEDKILGKLATVSQQLNILEPLDGRNRLARNVKGKKWRRRSIKGLKGMVWHQELGWGSVEAVARYHTGKNSHLCKGGAESISYTFAIRRDGQIILCNDLNKATWSQGYKGRKGDENAEFIGVMFEGMFHGQNITDSSAGEPNFQQMLSAMILWHVCKELWNWHEDDLYGHHIFDKPACPGDTLQTVINAIRINSTQEQQVTYDFRTGKGRQQALKALDYYKGKVDGIWGPRSRGALIKFQSAARLVSDGIWGPKSEAAVIKKLKR